MRNKNLKEKELIIANVTEAQEIIAAGEKKLEKAGLAKMIAWIGSGISLLTLILYLLVPSLATVTWVLAFGCAITAYVFAGGLDKAFKAAWKVAKFGWFIVPYFPIDLMVGVLAAGFAVYFFVGFPIILVSISLKQTRRDMTLAENYLQNYYSYNMI